ncbi:MAG: hypothetical protein AABZ06_00015 [Bdellovibrionota bacterium]
MDPRRPAYKIAFILDDRLPKQKSAVLMSHVNAIRQLGEVQLFKCEKTESDLINIFTENQFHLILAPWHKYLTWSRLEALYGLNRTSGPTFAGYHCELISLNEQPPYLRTILLDFSAPSTSETVLTVRSLINDISRSGIKSLLSHSTTIYQDTWAGPQSLGNKLDSVMRIPEITNYHWTRRSTALRICICALWSLVYEEGPGKTERENSGIPRADFQIAADTNCLIMRICYYMPSWSPKAALQEFWPDGGRPAAPSQLLARYSDFLRVHTIVEAGDVEITAALFRSGMSEKKPGHIHTLWVEPISARIVRELPFSNPLKDPAMKPLITNTAQENAIPQAAGDSRLAKHSENDEEKYQLIQEAAEKVRALKNLLNDRENKIMEMRSGGISTAKLPPPPGPENLVEALREHLVESILKIKQFEQELTSLEANGAAKNEIESLHVKITNQTKKEQVWIDKLERVIGAYREACHGACHKLNEENGNLCQFKGQKT